MASQDDILQSRAPKAYKDERGGATLVPHATIGIVKNNIDPLRSGKIDVFLKHLYSSDENNPDNWTPVNYMSPFFGYTNNSGSPNEFGNFVGNRSSYGFWATPPDINTEVVCIFINGQIDYGFYIGSIPLPTLNHMVPAIGADDYIIPNTGEANSYGGAVRLPTLEYNDANTGQRNSDTPHENPRPVHSVQASIFNRQGLLRDKDRGPITSSANRESPSQVFGFSTPGPAIYAGGFNGKDNTPLNQAVNNASIPDTEFTVIGRTGGHSFVMDDGDINGNDKLVRLRTSLGHMILMNDTAETLFIIHANGQSWVELGKEGTIDMYASNSVNIRTQGDLNLHADRNININAAKDLNISAQNINQESLAATKQFVGTTYQGFVKGAYTLKVNDKMSLYSKGDSSIKSDGTNYLNGGPNVHLNTGASSLVPQEVKQLPITAHTDTLYDEEKGFIPSPGKLLSVVNRAPAHQPWVNANQGVDVKIDFSASTNLPSAPSETIARINTQATATDSISTNSALVSTVPNLNPVGNPLDKVTTATLVSQMAVNAGTGATKNIIPQTAGVLDTNGQKVAVIGSLGLTPTQLEDSGYFKPGSAVAINAAISNGKTLEQAMAPNVFTNKDGISNFNSLVKNQNAQASAAASLLGKSEMGLISEGVITGKESSGQIGGLIVAGATLGVNSISSFAKENKVVSLPNTIPADPTTLVSGGNKAGNLADKLKSGITNVSDSIKGLAAGAFNSIKNTFVALKPNVPQNLKAPEKTFSQKSSEANIVNEASSSFSIGNGVSTDLKNIAESIASNKEGFVTGVSGDLKNKIDTNGGSLLGLANTGLSQDEITKLQSAISSAGTPGAVDVKIPTVGENTVNLTGLSTQTTQLLGNPKIPSLFPSPQIKSTPAIAPKPDPSAKANYLSLKKEADMIVQEVRIKAEAKNVAYKNYTTGKGSLEAFQEAERELKEITAKQAEIQRKVFDAYASYLNS